MSRYIFFFIILQPPNVKKHKTVKRYLLGIIWDRLVDFKYRGKYLVAALEAE